MFNFIGMGSNTGSAVTARYKCINVLVILFAFVTVCQVHGIAFFFNNLDWGSSSALCPLEALQSVRLIVRFPVFLNHPTLAARCLSRPQPAVVP